MNPDQGIGVFLRRLWRWRTDLLFATALLALFGYLSVKTGVIVASMLTAAVITLTLVVPPIRSQMFHAFDLSHARGRFENAIGRCIGSTLVGRCPKVTDTERVAVGRSLDTELKPGTEVGDLIEVKERLAAIYEATDVRVRRDADQANKVAVTIVKNDPLRGDPMVSPLVMGLRREFSEPQPWGVDEDGNVVLRSLPGHLLVAGEPRSGKSNGLSQIVSVAALDPAMVLHPFDPQELQYQFCRPFAYRFVGADIEDAIDALVEIRSLIAMQLSELARRGQRKVEPGDGLALHFIAMDEVQYFTCHPDIKARDRFLVALQAVCAQGAAAGFHVGMSTQSPGIDVVPSAIKDLISYRWAFRTATIQASDKVLGTGWAAQGYSASTIASEHRGVSFLMSEGTAPVRMRAFLIDDASLATIADHAMRLRSACSVPYVDEDDDDGELWTPA